MSAKTESTARRGLVPSFGPHLRRGLIILAMNCKRQTACVSRRSVCAKRQTVRVRIDNVCWQAFSMRQSRQTACQQKISFCMSTDGQREIVSRGQKAEIMRQRTMKEKHTVCVYEKVNSVCQRTVSLCRQIDIIVCE